MKRYKMMIVAGLIAAGIAVGGCTKKQAQNSQEAIEQAKQQADTKAQADYLIKQAQNFIKKQEFNEAIAVANYVQKNYAEYKDQASQIIETAKAQLKEKAQAAVDEAQNKVDTAVGDLKGKIGSFGQ